MGVTLQQIAEAAGVSRGTVDRALNNRGRINPEVAEMVKKTAEEMGYVHKLRKRQKNTSGKKKIGIVTQLSGSSFMLEVNRGIQTGKKELEEREQKRLEAELRVKLMLEAEAAEREAELQRMELRQKKQRQRRKKRSSQRQSQLQKQRQIIKKK